MKMLNDAAVEERPAVADHDHWIICGYAVLACLMLIAIYFASGGPSLSDADLMSAVAMP